LPQGIAQRLLLDPLVLKNPSIMKKCLPLGYITIRMDEGNGLLFPNVLAGDEVENPK